MSVILILKRGCGNLSFYLNVYCTITHKSVRCEYPQYIELGFVGLPSLNDCADQSSLRESFFTVNLLLLMLLSLRLYTLQPVYTIAKAESSRERINLGRTCPKN